MAYIDKIYLNETQYKVYMNWIEKNTYTKDSMRKTLRSRCNKTNVKEPFAICNYDAKTDKWLARYCPFGFILNRLCEQYDCNLQELENI